MIIVGCHGLRLGSALSQTHGTISVRNVLVSSVSCHSAEELLRKVKMLKSDNSGLS